MKIQETKPSCFDLTIDTHMGILSGSLSLCGGDAPDGSLAFMGKVIPFESCRYEPDVYYAEFQAMGMPVKLFFSVNADSALHGAATAPRHQVMQVSGKRIEEKPCEKK